MADTMLTGHPLNQAIDDVDTAINKVDGWDIPRRISEAETAADTIAEGAAILAITDPKRLRHAEKDLHQNTVADAVTYGLAILAHRPQGVTFAGRHWCTSHTPCPGPGSLNLPPFADPGTTGAVFTPRHLADEVTVHTLEAVCYDPGPLQTTKQSEWVLRPSTEILSRHIGDIACGSGSFLIASVKYTADRLTEAWARESGTGSPEPMRLLARHAAMRCVYGVDLGPTYVELARLAVALLAPTIDVDLTGNIQCGDSLMGVTHWDQITHMNLDSTGPAVFTRTEIDAMRSTAPILDRRCIPWVLANLVCGAALRGYHLGKRHMDPCLGEAATLGRALVDDPSLLDEAAATANEWLQTGRPENAPHRNPMHWPLAFPHVFGTGIERNTP